MSPSPPPASSPARQSCSGVMRQLFSSSAVARRPVRKALFREGRAKTFSSADTDWRAAYISSTRPPASSAGAASPPAAAKTRLASRVKETTSAYWETRLPAMAHSRRSASWDCCSGTMSSFPPAPLRAPMASSRAVVFPAPERPSTSFSTVLSPFSLLCSTLVKSLLPMVSYIKIRRNAIWS